MEIKIGKDKYDIYVSNLDYSIRKWQKTKPREGKGKMGWVEMHVYFPNIEWALEHLAEKHLRQKVAQDDIKDIQQAVKEFAAIRDSILEQKSHKRVPKKKVKEL